MGGGGRFFGYPLMHFLFLSEFSVFFWSLYSRTMFIQPPSFKHDAGQTLPAIVFPPPPPCLGQQDGVCYSEAISCCDFGVVAMTTLELVCWNVQSARNLNIIGGTRNFFSSVKKEKKKTSRSYILVSQIQEGAQFEI